MSRVFVSSKASLQTLYWHKLMISFQASSSNLSVQWPETMRGSQDQEGLSCPNPGRVHQVLFQWRPEDVTVEHGSCTALLTGSWICGLSAVPIPVGHSGDRDHGTDQSLGAVRIALGVPPQVSRPCVKPDLLCGSGGGSFSIRQLPPAHAQPIRVALKVFDLKLKELPCKYLRAWPRTWLAPSTEGRPQRDLWRGSATESAHPISLHGGAGEDYRHATQKVARPSSGSASPRSGLRWEVRPPRGVPLGLTEEARGG